MFAARLDGLDHEITFLGTVDLPGHAVILAWREDVGFGEVVQPINPSRRVVSHDEHNTGAVFRPLEQDEIIGAEVEHRRRTGEREPQLPHPLAAPLRGYPMDSSKRDIATARRMIGAGLLGRRIGIFVRLAETVTAEQEDFGVLHQAVGDGGRDCRVVEDIAPVGKGCIRGDDR